MVALAATFVPVDGRMTSLQELDIPLTGDEVMEIVSPGNAAEGNNYQVTTLTLGAYFGSFQYSNTVVVPEGDTYPVEITNTRILVGAGTASPTSIVFPLASTMFSPYPVLVKDLVGDAANNAITITFTGGELCDGLSSIEINSAYGWVTVNPTPGGGSWYMS